MRRSDVRLHLECKEACPQQFNVFILAVDDRRPNTSGIQNIINVHITLVTGGMLLPPTFAYG
jgi:hypothetical protein